MGSIIVVMATDAPLSGLSLRPGGQARGHRHRPGRHAGRQQLGRHLPGVLDRERRPDAAIRRGLLLTKAELNIDGLDPFYLAAVEAVEEAVVNAIVAGEDMPTVKPAGKICRGIDHDRLRAIFAKG